MLPNTIQLLSLFFAFFHTNSVLSQVQAPFSEPPESAASESFASAASFPIPRAEFTDACTRLRNNLTEQEISVCEHFEVHSKLGIWIDVLAPICGYKVDCLRDPNPSRRQECVPDVGPGILYDQFVRHRRLSFMRMKGGWEEIERSIACLKDQKQMTRNLGELHVTTDQNSSSSYNGSPSLIVDAIATMMNLKDLTLTVFPPSDTGLAWTASETDSAVRLRTLTLGLHVHPIIQHLPALKTVHTWKIAPGDMWLFPSGMGWWKGTEDEAFRLLLQAIGSSNVTEASLFVQGMKSNEDWEFLAQALSKIEILRLLPVFNLTQALPFLRTMSNLKQLTIAAPPRDTNKSGSYTDFWNEGRAPLSSDENDKLVAVVCNSLPDISRLEYTETLSLWTNKRKENCSAWRYKCSSGDIDCNMAILGSHDAAAGQWSGGHGRG